MEPSIGYYFKRSNILPGGLDTSLIVLLFVKSFSTFSLNFCFFSEVRSMVILRVLMWYPRNMISCVGVKMDFSGYKHFPDIPQKYPFPIVYHPHIQLKTTLALLNMKMVVLVLY